LALYIFYLANYYVILVIMSNYIGMDNFNSYFWLIGFLIGPLYSYLLLTIYFIILILGRKLFKMDKIEQLSEKHYISSLFYFIFSNLVITLSIDGNDTLF